MPCAVLFDGPSRQTIPLELYVANLRKIIALVPSSVPLLLIVRPSSNDVSPLPVRALYFSLTDLDSLLSSLTRRPR